MEFITAQGDTIEVREIFQRWAGHPDVTLMCAAWSPPKYVLEKADSADVSFVRNGTNPNQDPYDVGYRVRNSMQVCVVKGTWHRIDVFLGDLLLGSFFGTDSPGRRRPREVPHQDGFSE